MNITDPHPPLFCYVILHFKTWWDTIECVESILNTTYKNKKIIIVNNDEDREAKSKLDGIFIDNDVVTLIHTGKNLGFSLGNNVGFEHAKYKLKADFIVLSNNDIIVEDKKIAEKIINKYEEESYHILGPDIISTVDQHHQNPRFELYTNIQRVELFMKNFRRLLWLNYFHIDRLLLNLKKKIKPDSTLPQYDDNLNHIEEQWGVKLHGSFLVFSPLYITSYEGLYPLESMHMEESFLYYIVRRDKLKTIFFPACKVLHKEDSATNHVYGKGVFKRRFYLSNCLRSSRELLKLMKQDNKNE